MLGQTNKDILSKKLHRKLRRKMTKAELALWRLLKHSQLSGLKFRRQHPFGNYILDFVCLRHKLLIEVDGSQHLEQMPHDEERTKILTKAGFTVLRFWNNEVLQQAETVMEKIWLAAQDKRPHPHPDPPLEGEGEAGGGSD